MRMPLGRDLDPATLKRLEAVATGAAGDAAEVAQLHELAFWRWVCVHGYSGGKPEDFPAFQRQLMLGCYAHTRWPVDRFRDGRVFEFGCGPLGMVESLPCREAVAFDPLNVHYSMLFENVRSPAIRYLSTTEELAAIGEFDLGICFNVLDHTQDARACFDVFWSKIRAGGAFILQINTVREGFPRTAEHARMHPSPLAEEAVLGWLRAVSADVDHMVADQPSADNEFFLMAWGTKTSGPA